MEVGEKTKSDIPALTLEYKNSAIQSKVPANARGTFDDMNHRNYVLPTNSTNLTTPNNYMTGSSMYKERQNTADSASAHSVMDLDADGNVNSESNLNLSCKNNVQRMNVNNDCSSANE